MSPGESVPPRWGSTRKETGHALTAQPEALDQGVVALYVVVGEVAELPATLPDELQKPASRGEIVLVLAEVLCQVHDPGGEQGYLDFR